MKELGAQMTCSLVRWANLGCEMPDGTLTKTASHVWCSAQTLPDLSGWRSDKEYANDSTSTDRDEYGMRSVSPARRARGHAFRTGLVQLIVETLADSTRVISNGVISNRARTSVSKPKVVSFDNQLADFVDNEGLEALHTNVIAFPTDRP